MTTDKLRHQINPLHPVFGESYRMLEDHETIQLGDQTACVSVLLELDSTCRYWYTIQPNDRWLGNTIGQTVAFACDQSGDMDGHERVFRRKL